jgi:hypothetical protein
LETTETLGQVGLPARFAERIATAKHSERRIASLIDVPLWDQAKWRGTLFYFDPRLAPYPVLGIGFEDQDAATKIFRGLRKQVGKSDDENRLRITILRGIRKSQPAAYRVVIGTNIDRRYAKGMLIMMVNRIHVMEPDTSQNLDRFLETLKGAPDYLLAPALFGRGQPNIGIGLAIRKTELVVRNAWELGLHDIDIVGLASDDDPIVPQGVDAPPCREALEFLKNRARL